MKKFLLILIFLIYSIGVAYGFEIQAENTTQPEINKTNLKEIKNIMDIRPKAEITSDVSIPIAEPVSKVETQEEKSLGENINETIPNDNKVSYVTIKIKGDNLNSVKPNSWVSESNGSSKYIIGNYSLKPETSYNYIQRR